MHFSTLPIALLGLVTASLAAPSTEITRRQGANLDFSETCNQIHLDPNGHFLYASCANNNKQYLNTVLDLNGCVTNNNGNLQAGKGGDYALTCNQCSIAAVPGEVTLTCECNGNSKTSINVEPFIGNNIGTLVCL